MQVRRRGADDRAHQALATPALGAPWVCPALEHLSIEGCSGLAWTALRALVQARQPVHTRHFAALAPGAWEWPAPEAAAPAHVRSLSSPPCADGGRGRGWPARLRSLDVSRCRQLSGTMLGWLARAGCAVVA
jgi:hypothetical protein